MVALEPILLMTVAIVLRARPCTMPMELGPAPMFVHVEAAAGTACGCETVGAESEGLDPHRWDVGQRGACWPGGSHEPSFSAQSARTAGMALSRYYS